jgi:hypothetical protein
MVLDAFRFMMSLPADADLLPLVREVSTLMVRYLGLPEDEARKATERLEHVLTDRLKHLGAGGGTIQVEFERPHTAETVTVELVSTSLPEEPAAAGKSGIAPARDDGRSRIRWSWPVHDEE